jgi:hypothetical protein
MDEGNALPNNRGSKGTPCTVSANVSNELYEKIENLAIKKYDGVISQAVRELIEDGFKYRSPSDARHLSEKSQEQIIRCVCKCVSEDAQTSKTSLRNRTKKPLLSQERMGAMGLKPILLVCAFLIVILSLIAILSMTAH